jgi:hypothetical protein
MKSKWLLSQRSHVEATGQHDKNNLGQMMILIQKYQHEFSSRYFFYCSEIHSRLYQHILKLSGNIKKVSKTDWQIHNLTTADSH